MGTCNRKLNTPGKECCCTVCNEHFSTITVFDKHRRGNDSDRRCLDPAEIGLVTSQRASGPVWHFPSQQYGSD